MTLLALLLVLGDDPRLAVRATLDDPRLTYAEIGAWVQRSTGVPVEVAPAIRERKATVLVEDRPVRETMDRIAEALFLDWEPTKDGLRLRLAPGVAQEEARIQATEASAWTQGLRDALSVLVESASYTPERLQAQYLAANADAARLAKDETPGGKAQAAAASAKAARLGLVAYNASNQAVGKLLATLAPQARESILNGATLYASDHPTDGVLSLPQSATDLVNSFSSGPADAEQVLCSLRYDLLRNQIVFQYARRSKNGFGGTSATISGSDGPGYRQALANEPLTARLRAWATMDKAVGETKLPPEDGKAPAYDRITPYVALAELLTKLHARTGLPIVADGYRPAIVSRRPPEGADVARWLRELGPWSDGRYRGYRVVARGSNGWLMLRHSRYWQQIPREVPERLIRPLEAAARRKEGATLEEYAAFAGGLTPAQIPWTGGDALVMDAPYRAIEGNVAFLRLWNALPSALRRAAQTETGLPWRSFTAPQAELYRACLAEQMGGAFAPSAALPYALPGGPPLPDDLRLFVRSEARVFVQEFEEQIVNEPYRRGGWNSARDVVPGFYASLGPSKNVAFASYSVPLHPAPPIDENGEIRPRRPAP